MAKASPDDLIDAHVSTHQCKLAIDALRTHELKNEQKQQETELLPRKEQHVWLVVAVKQMHPEKKLTPFKIPIVHPLVDPRTTPICLITKDPQRQYKDLLESHGIKFISRVVGLEKLKGKFKPFEARRLLLKENGMFLADDRVIPLLPTLLGKKWFEAKKQPIPVCLTRKDLKSELERAVSSTYMHQNRGTCTSIKISTLSQSPVQILANLTSALPAIVSHIKGGWSNIQSLHIKTNSSVSLPVWSCSLDEGEGGEGRWAGMKVDDGDADEGASSSSEEGPPKTKGKKRSLDEDGEKPRKKVKDTTQDKPSNTPAEATTAVKLKKRKSVTATKEPTPAPEAHAVPDLPVNDAETPNNNKKRTPTDTGDLKKQKRARVSISEPRPRVTAPVAAARSDNAATGLNEVPSPKKSSKREKKQETVAQSAATSARSSSLAAPVGEKDLEKKPRKPKKSAAVVDGSSADKSASVDAVPVSKDELKQKKRASGAEKKKDKVIGNKGGKSAKDAIIGKRVARG